MDNIDVDRKWGKKYTRPKGFVFGGLYARINEIKKKGGLQVDRK